MDAQDRLGVTIGVALGVDDDDDRPRGAGTIGGDCFPHVVGRLRNPGGRRHLGRVSSRSTGTPQPNRRWQVRALRNRTPGTESRLSEWSLSP
jgi:hypothetical protein